MSSKDKTSLVLGRRIGTGVKVGEDIEVYVLSTRRGSTRLRIVAPRDHLISRLDEQRVYLEADNDAATEEEAGYPEADS